jgi:uncharacterized protein YutE (UPF0331/DUF86 family)
MPQLRTKLSERREIARARKSMKRAERLVNSLTPVELANLNRRSIGKTAYQISVELLRDMAASAVRDKTIRDDVGIPADMIEAITRDNVEDFLSELVEHDVIIDDAVTHQAFRKILDDLREAVGKIDDKQANLKTMTYLELMTYPTPADLPALAFTGQFDFGTFNRLSHIHNFALWTEKTGTNIDDDGKLSAEAQECWICSAADTIVETLAQGSCTVAQVADAMGLDEDTVTRAWEGHKAEAKVTALRPT